MLHLRLTHSAAAAHSGRSCCFAIVAAVLRLLSYAPARRLPRPSPLRLLPRLLQKCLCVVDVWYGWRGKFKEYAAAKYPWIKFVYVPANQTEDAQPCDRGFYAIIKAHMRRMWGASIVAMVVARLKAGDAPESIAQPLKETSTKTDLTRLLAKSVSVVTKEQVLQCWASVGVKQGASKNGILDAFDADVQNLAVEMHAEGKLFGNKEAQELDDNGAEIVDEAYDEGANIFDDTKASEEYIPLDDGAAFDEGLVESDADDDGWRDSLEQGHFLQAMLWEAGTRREGAAAGAASKRARA